MEGLELQCFQIISAVGMARSSYIEAIQEAKKGNFEEAKKYRKAFGNFIRAVQWKDLIVEVYIRQD